VGFDIYGAQSNSYKKTCQIVSDPGYPELPKKNGEHIRKHRMVLKLFQKDVADMIGVSECTVYNWERRGHEPEVKHIPKIIGFLGYDRLIVIEIFWEGYPILRRSRV
jgi:DNA-binding XRE family transcriptional regulator